MFKSGFVLSSDAHMQAAMFNKTPVEVWQQDELIDYGGLIVSINENVITINDGKYLKAVCEFKVR